MIKNIVMIAIAITASLTSCKKDDTQVNKNNDISSQINAFPKEALSADEISSLKWMREEEKLAHDVYIALSVKWNSNIYTNIAASEQTHTNAVLTLLNKYTISDPVGTNGLGVFSDSTIQGLYNQLVTEGSKTVLDGYKIGATIEDLDIYDLNNWNTKIDNKDIQFVYLNLNKGSRNHLRSFYSQIIGLGGTYTAQYISQTDLDDIINSPKETGAW